MAWKGIKKNLYLASIKIFIWHQKNLFRPRNTKIVCFCVLFAFMDGWFGFSPAASLGRLETPKRYPCCDLAARKRPNVTHSMIWRPKGA